MGAPFPIERAPRAAPTTHAPRANERPWTLARAGLLVLGLLFTALGLLGAVLPVLPTTPFLLLAAACFARSSPALHRRLLANRTFGPLIADWQQTRTIPRSAKRKAGALVLVTFAVSIALVDPLGLRLALGALGLALIGLLAWLPETPAGPDRGGEAD